MADITPAPLHAAPSDKERKYDRQLRLWAASGQAALENAHVLLINSGTGVAGVETLKNLVLPGIGQYTILDSAQVTEADLGVNFFLEDDDVGKFRAERTCALLQELNPEVKGHAITEPLETFITAPNALAPYTFILVILPIPPEIHEQVVQHGSQTNTPAFYIHCVGFYAHLTAQLPSAFPIVDTHPDPASTTDLRLLEPWPDLSALVEDKTANIDDLDNEEHGHIPYVLLLLHYLSVWKSTHSGNPPSTYTEKTQFRTLIHNSTRRNTAEGSEENFDEAAAAVLKTLHPHTPSAAVQEVLTAPECTHPTAFSSSFWLIANAIASFNETNGVLPLSGTLPDMKATSALYIQLQNVYKSKARADVAAVTASVRQLEKRLNHPKETPAKEVEAFCRSAGHVKLLRGTRPHVLPPPSDGNSSGSSNDIEWGSQAAPLVEKVVQDIADESGFMPPSLLPLYLAFLAYDTYTLTHSTTVASKSSTALVAAVDDASTTLAAKTAAAKGVQQQEPLAGQSGTNDDLATVAFKTTAIAHHHLDALIKAAGSFVEDPGYSNVEESLGQIVAELVRARGTEMHNIAAVTGGVAAQEVIKVVTGQYVPVDNTWLYDGVHSVMSVLKI